MIPGRNRNAQHPGDWQRPYWSPELAITREEKLIEEDQLAWVGPVWSQDYGKWGCGYEKRGFDISRR